MKRREVLGILGGVATWPLAVRAQQPPPVLGLLAVGTKEVNAFRLDAVRQGLRETGYVEGRNITIEYRWAEGPYDHLPTLASNLVDMQVALIVAIGATNSALAAKAATATIPVVFMVGGDPVKFGLVASLNRPGGNVTGISYLANALVAKQLEVLHEFVPQARSVGLLVNPGNSNADSDARQAKDATEKLGLRLVVAKASVETDVETAFAIFVQQGVGGFILMSDVWLNNRRDELIALATRHALPGIYSFREYVLAGGLMSYGGSVTDAYRLVGVYAGRILEGEKPADLPVQQSTKVELIINLKTARALGLDVPPTLLARADEVIE
jgi:putative tryptophan/tyrosine transport system substrate-binding protein